MRRPLVLWLAYVIAVLMIAVAARTAFPSLRAGADGLSALQVAVQAVLTLLPLPLAHYVGWRAVGFVRPRDLAVGLFPAATIAFGYLAPWSVHAVTTTLLAVVLVALVALGEEITFEGFSCLAFSRATGSEYP